MSKDLGLKHSCFKCATKFYDLRKPVPACPKCGADQRDKPAATPKATVRKPPVAKTEPAAEVVEEFEAAADEGDDEDEADDG
jgi:uncharacterized protein (TIGR02300 family)